IIYRIAYWHTCSKGGITMTSQAQRAHHGGEATGHGPHDVSPHAVSALLNAEEPAGRSPHPPKQGEHEKHTHPPPPPPPSPPSARTAPRQPPLYENNGPNPHPAGSQEELAGGVYRQGRISGRRAHRGVVERGDRQQPPAIALFR